MKHLKEFEEVKMSDYRGDLSILDDLKIVVTNPSNLQLRYGINKGDIFTGYYSSKDDSCFIRDKNGRGFYFSGDQFRQATSEDISNWELKNNANKYNI